METAEEFIARKKKIIEKGEGKVRAKDIGRKGTFGYKIVKATFMKQHNLPEKVFIVERLERNYLEGEVIHKSLKKGDIEYRIGYYIVGKNGNKKNKWTWGQFCPMIPLKDFNKLIKKAKDEGTIIETK